MSLRLRLTLLYSGILALTLIMFSIALYFTVSQVALQVVKEGLATQAQNLLMVHPFHLDAIDYPTKKFAAKSTAVQTRGVDGTVRDRVNLGDQILPLSNDELQRVLAGDEVARIAQLGNDPVLVYSRPIKVYNQVIGVLQLARSFDDQNQALSVLQRILISSSLLVLLAAFGVGWMLAGTALHPINRITQTAQAIGAERDFDRRVAHTGPNDEIGRLAMTFNTMLAALQTAYRQVEQSLQAQRRFAADASHELRTPLTSIRGNIELLQREPPIKNEDRVAVLNDMQEECERLIRLVNALLTLARADTGRSLRSEPIQIKPLLEDVCRMVQMLNPARRIECDHLLDIEAIGDRDAIRQIILILIDNALKFTPPHGAITATMDANDGQVLISVRDTGVGISPAILPHIFERFFRGDAARSGTGTGLGLAIAKSLVEAQQGTIAVQSMPGQGSVFTVALPQSTSQTTTKKLPPPEHY